MVSKIVELFGLLNSLWFVPDRWQVHACRDRSCITFTPKGAGKRHFLLAHSGVLYSPLLPALDLPRAHFRAKPRAFDAAAHFTPYAPPSLIEAAHATMARRLYARLAAAPHAGLGVADGHDGKRKR